MIELLLLISGIVALWRFSGSTAAIAEGASVKSQVWAESIISESVLERAQHYKDFKEQLAKDDLEIISHETFMKELRGK